MKTQFEALAKTESILLGIAELHCNYVSGVFEDGSLLYPKQCFDYRIIIARAGNY